MIRIWWDGERWQCDTSQRSPSLIKKNPRLSFKRVEGRDWVLIYRSAYWFVKSIKQSLPLTNRWTIFDSLARSGGACSWLCYYSNNTSCTASATQPFTLQTACSRMQLLLLTILIYNWPSSAGDSGNYYHVRGRKLCDQSSSFPITFTHKRDWSIHHDWIWDLSIVCT